MCFKVNKESDNYHLLIHLFFVYQSIYISTTYKYIFTIYLLIYLYIFTIYLQ